MKRHLLVSILLLVAMQVCALPNLIGRWETAPMWDRYEKTIMEINFKDTVNFEVKVSVDNTDFSEGELSSLSIRGTYQLQDTMCIFTADKSTFVATSALSSRFDISEATGPDYFLILPSNNSNDVIALIDHLNREVFVFYRQTEKIQ